MTHLYPWSSDAGVLPANFWSPQSIVADPATSQGHLEMFALSRNTHQEFAEILSAQGTDEGLWSPLEPLNHVFAIFDSALADPGRDIAHEIPITRRKVGDYETLKLQPFGQDRSHQVRQEDWTGVIARSRCTCR